MDSKKYYDEEKELFSDSDSSSEQKRRERSRSNSDNQKYSRMKPEQSEDRSFVIKNGCCKDCMRAFSKSGKSCLCQVPKFERKYTLPEKGCNFCGCRGCNPADVRKEVRRSRKREFMEDKNILYKKQRILDSDDEELKVFK